MILEKHNVDFFCFGADLGSLRNVRVETSNVSIMTDLVNMSELE